MELLPIFELPFKSAFLIFILFAFIGWVSEEIYVGVIIEHRFVNRGFLHGPLCPVYGFGGVVILMLPPQLYNTWIPLFFASMILCTIVEYFVSWLMEVMFHARWWDYSHFKINLNGRVCLLNSVLFGFLGLGVIHFVYPYIIQLLNWMGDFMITVTAESIAVILIVDLFFTVRKLVDFARTMEKLKNFGESLRCHYGHEEWFRGESLAEMMASVKENAQIDREKVNQNIVAKIEKMQTLKSVAAESFINHFPTMKSVVYKEELAHLKFSMLKLKIKNKIKKQ